MSEWSFFSVPHSRFLSVPHNGEVPEPPLEGWRVERVVRGRMVNSDNDGVLRSDPCHIQPRGLFAVPQFGAAHEPPHPWCECGVRIVGDLQSLSDYWAHGFKMTTAAGLSFEEKYGSDDLVVVRLRSTGVVAPGHAIPHDDPVSTIRAAAGEVLEIYCPPWTDTTPIERQYPHVAVRHITELGSVFSDLRQPCPPESTLRVQHLKHHLRVKTGICEVMVPRSHVQPPAVMDAVWGYMSGEHGSGQNLSTIVDRLVIPLTDLSDPLEQQGCALGLAVGLAFLATIRKGPPHDHRS